MSLLHATARNCGGQYFHLKSVLGDVMLSDEDCDEILCTLLHLTSSHNSSLKKQTPPQEQVLKQQQFHWMTTKGRRNKDCCGGCWYKMTSCKFHYRKDSLIGRQER